MSHYDELETRSADAREAAQLEELRKQVAQVSAAPGSLSPEEIGSLTDLAKLPVLRKSQLAEWQAAQRPFGGIRASNVAQIFQSPGPIYEPGGVTRDWWRIGRFLHACGIGTSDIVQNCFGYHLTPAGHIFENGARAVGAVVVPAGTGQTDLQVRAAADLGVTAYAGTPDYLKIILEKADEMGETLGITKAVVGGGALPLARDYMLETERTL
ncbi:MAG: phenylacetate--CoA ligase family protein, partial [Pseudomonadota bacterium]